LLTRQDKVDPDHLARRLEKARLNQVERWKEEAKEMQLPILVSVRKEIERTMRLQVRAIRSEKAIKNTWRDVSDISQPVTQSPTS
jgi:electron transfer flavoprotein alpha/beta subunit